MAETSINSESIEIGQGEKKDLLDLVVEKQQDRGLGNAGTDIPHILLPYQARWHADMAPVRLGRKSRRIGWSWGCMAAEGALEAARERGGMSQYYMGYNLGMAAENIGDALKFAQIYGVAASSVSVSRDRETMTVKDQERGVIGESKQDITRFKITFKSGHVYEALSSAPWNWRGRQGHARIDEAAFHRNLREVVKGAMAFLMWGGRVDIVSSENGEDSEFHALVRDIEAGKLDWSMHKVDFDEAVAEGLYQRICLVKGEVWTREKEQAWRDKIFSSYSNQEDANEELLCIPKKGSGLYMPRFLVEQCQDDSIPRLSLAKGEAYVTDPNRLAETKQWCLDVLKPVIDNMDHSRRSAYGQDFGRTGDLSVIWVLQESSSSEWRTAFELSLRNLPFDVQALIRDFILDNIPHFQHASFDARGNGQSHAEGAVQRYGEYRVTCVMATASWYAEWFPRYKSAYEAKAITVVGGEDVITDHRRVVLQGGRPRMDDGRDKGTDGQYRHGDSAIAGLMAWHAASQEGQPAAGATVEPTADVYKAPRIGRLGRWLHKTLLIVLSPVARFLRFGWACVANLNFCGFMNLHKAVLAGRERSVNEVY